MEREDRRYPPLSADQVAEELALEAHEASCSFCANRLAAQQGRPLPFPPSNQED